jgi:hypothetical protein
LGVQQDSQNVDRAVLIVLAEDLLCFDGRVRSYERKMISGVGDRLWSIGVGLKLDLIVVFDSCGGTG